MITRFREDYRNNAPSPSGTSSPPFDTMLMLGVPTVALEGVSKGAYVIRSSFCGDDGSYSMPVILEQACIPYSLVVERTWVNAIPGPLVYVFWCTPRDDLASPCLLFTAIATTAHTSLAQCRCKPSAVVTSTVVRTFLGPRAAC